MIWCAWVIVDERMITINVKFLHADGASVVPEYKLLGMNIF